MRQIEFSGKIHANVKHGVTSLRFVVSNRDDTHLPDPVFLPVEIHFRSPTLKRELCVDRGLFKVGDQVKVRGRLEVNNEGRAHAYVFIGGCHPVGSVETEQWVPLSRHMAPPSPGLGS